MSWNFIISFFIGLAVYLLILLGIFLYKKIKYKKNFDKEVKQKERKEDGTKENKD